MVHLLVSYTIVKEDTDFEHNLIVVNPNEVNSTRCESFKTFNGIAHHKNGFAKAWDFFLKVKGARDRRVVIEIQGVIALAMATIHPDLIEVIK